MVDGWMGGRLDLQPQVHPVPASGNPLWGCRGPRQPDFIHVSSNGSGPSAGPLTGHGGDVVALPARFLAGSTIMAS